MNKASLLRAAVLLAMCIVPAVAGRTLAASATAANLAPATKVEDNSTFSPEYKAGTSHPTV